MPSLLRQYDQQPVCRSKHRSQIPGELRMRESPDPDLVAKFVGRPADVPGMTGYHE